MVNFLQDFYINNIGGLNVDTIIFINKFYLVDNYISRYDLYIDKIIKNDDVKAATITLLSDDGDVCGYIELENQKLNVKIIKRILYHDENICEYLNVDKDIFCGCLRDFIGNDYMPYYGDKELDEVGIMNDVYFDNNCIASNNGDTYYHECLCENDQLLEALNIYRQRKIEISNSITCNKEKTLINQTR